MAYDAARHVAVVFGGRVGATLLGDTWTWNGHAWLLQHPTNSPSARAGSAIVYDARHQVVLLFGGADRLLNVPGSAFRNDTWTWDGCTWTPMHSSGSPELAEAVAAYDGATNSVVLFGYEFGGLAQTWRWNDGGWILLHPSSSPPASSGASMAYDAASHRVVLFGGFNQHSGFMNDTWTWDGANWTREHPKHRPAPRRGAASSPDPAGAGIDLIGGIGADSRVLNEFWVWDGADWSQRQAQALLVAREGAAAASDNDRRAIVLFGGVVANVSGGRYADDTWTWDGRSWARAGGS